VNLFEDLRNKIGKSVTETSNASKRMIELSKLNYKRKEKKREADEIAEEIGWIVFTEWEKEQNISISKALKSGLERLQFIQKEIKNIDLEIEKVKNENKFNYSDGLSQINHSYNEPSSLLIYLCPYCAHQVGEDERQCRNCQKRFY
jgi:vacuolar-type H+-ATPase subunit E/Vma4